MIASGLYVYAIVRAEHPCRLSRTTGVGGVAGTPWQVRVGAVAAVVSTAVPDLRAKRRDLLVHHAVLSELMRQGVVLPMRFGVVSPDEDTLRVELFDHASRYRDLLAELTGRVELNVKMVPDEEQMLRAVAMAEPAVRRVRERGTATFEDRLEVGRAVASALADRQNTDTRTVLDALGSLSVRTAMGPRTSGCALNAGFLVERGQTARFVTAVDVLDREFGDRVVLRCTGPLPPYSFVDQSRGWTWDSTPDC